LTGCLLALALITASCGEREPLYEAQRFGRCLQQEYGTDAFRPLSPRPPVPADALRAARDDGLGYISAFGEGRPEGWAPALVLFFMSARDAGAYAASAAQEVGNVLVYYDGASHPRQRVLVEDCIKRSVRPDYPILD
jgi:hypothetical protein